MSLDGAALREWVQRVAHGMADRRTFLRTMMGLGLSGPCLANLLALYRPAQAQTTPPGADIVPTRRGGGGKLRLLWWQAQIILNIHLPPAPRTQMLPAWSTNHCWRLTQRP